MSTAMLIEKTDVLGFFEIGEHCQNQTLIFSKKTDCCVATATEESSNSTSLMAMINSQGTLGVSLRRDTHGAFSRLPFKHRLIFCNRNLIMSLKHIVTHLSLATGSHFATLPSLSFPFGSLFGGDPSLRRHPAHMFSGFKSLYASARSCIAALNRAIADHLFVTTSASIEPEPSHLTTAYRLSSVSFHQAGQPVFYGKSFNKSESLPFFMSQSAALPTISVAVGPNSFSPIGMSLWALLLSTHDQIIYLLGLTVKVFIS